MKKSFYIYFVFILSSFNSHSMEEKSNNKDNVILDRYHRTFTSYIHEKSLALDNFIGKPNNELFLENESYSILNIKQNFFSKSKNKTQLDLDLKIDLPYTEDKWKIFLSTNNTDFDSLEDKSRESYTSDNNFLEDNNESVGGLIFSDLNNKWKKKYRIGLKLHSPLNPFVKANFYHSYFLKDNLTQYFEQEFFYYKEEGFGTKTNLDYFYKDKNDIIYQSNSSIQFLNDKSDNLEFSQQFSRWEMLNSKASLKYSIGGSINSREELELNSYWVNAKWRYKLYKEWLFVKIIPEISFKEEYDYSAEYGIAIQLEMFFAKNKSLKKLAIQY